VKFRFVSAVLLVVILLGLMPVSAQDSHTLIVFAASSLTDAFTEISIAFVDAHPDVHIVYNFAGSSTLAAQLDQGAPADVFASANWRQMLSVREAGHIAGFPRTFALNRLVLITPADNPAEVESLHNLADPGLKLVLAAPAVPVRDYTNTMLEKLAADPDYGQPYRDAVLANVVSEEDNVRQVLLKVALGEADAGIVYQSDVTPDTAADVRLFPIPNAVNSLARYPIATVASAAESELAQAFVDYVLSPEGQTIIERWGFVPAYPA
jgi:molybdate transport system substrate-binding protein